MNKKLNILFLVALLSACSAETISEDNVVSEIVDVSTTLQTDEVKTSHDDHDSHNHDDHDSHNHDNGHTAHSHEPIEVNKDLPIPILSIEVIKDPKSGWNLFLNTENFKFNAEAASTEHVDGEGHAHLYINGKKITRLYGSSFFIEELNEGKNNIRVELSSNNHSPLAVDGEIIDASVVVEVIKSTDSESDVDNQNVQEENQEVSYDANVLLPNSTPDKLEVLNFKLNEKIYINFTSEAEREIHVHGYDIHFMVYPDKENVLELDLTIAGEFEIEDHDGGFEFARLIVSP